MPPPPPPTLDLTLTRALSFDIYATLIDWETGIVQAARSTALGPYLPRSDGELLRAIEAHDTAVQQERPRMKQREVIAEGLRRYAVELGAGFAAEGAGDTAGGEGEEEKKKKEKKKGGNLTAEQLRAACEQYGAQIGKYAAFGDTVAAMQRLGKRYRLIALTNVDDVSWEETVRGPLAGVEFDAVYTAEKIGSYKPDVRNFRYLIEHSAREFGIDSGGPGGELVHVSQSLFHDNRVATEVGLPSVWVDRGGHMGTMGETETGSERYGYQLKVKTLAELADVVDRAFAAKE